MPKSTNFRLDIKSQKKLRIEGCFGAFFGVLFILSVIIFWFRLPFIKPNFSEILPVILLSSFASITVSLLLLLFPVRILKFAQTTISFIFILIIGIFFLKDYPFDFAAIGLLVVDSIAPLIILLTIVASGLAIFAELYKLSADN